MQDSDLIEDLSLSRRVEYHEQILLLFDNISRGLTRDISSLPLTLDYVVDDENILLHHILSNIYSGLSSDSEAF